MQPAKVIERGVEVCGTRKELATHLGVSMSYVDKMRTLDHVPAKHCLRLHLLTGIPLPQLNPVFHPDFILTDPWEIRIMKKLRRVRAKKGGHWLLKDIELMLDLEG